MVCNGRCSNGIGRAVLRGHGPGIEKQQLHVEHQKGDRHQMKTHGKSPPGIVNRIHTAFVRHFFHGRVSPRSNQPRAGKHRNRNGGRDDDE